MSKYGMSPADLLAHLKRMNISEAIANENAMAGTSPAILLQWNGAEHYYTGCGSDMQDDPEIEDTLIAKYADQNLSK